MGAWIEIGESASIVGNSGVAPHVGAWIEIKAQEGTHPYGYVAPHVGAWIEIENTSASVTITTKSHPTWVRGLKWYQLVREYGNDSVAPHVGAWIEIDETVDAEIAKSVAPHVGAWIEIPRMHAQRLLC